MPAVRHLAIDETSALFAPGLGAVVACVNTTLYCHHFRLVGEGHDHRANFLRWRLRSRPFVCAVMRNIEPGAYIAEWAYGRLALDVVVLPERVTRVDWRAVAWFGQGSGTDRMVPMAMPVTIALPVAPVHVPGALSA
jgi:hypothetical protein